MRLARKLALAVHRAAARFGVHVLPVHYYSPVPDLRTLERTRSLWARPSELPGINVDLDAQSAALREICLPYQDEYAGAPAYRHAVEHRFGPGFGYIEAQALHGIVRHFAPPRIIEVGSGSSTWCMLAAARMNVAEGRQDSGITCIEPYPSAALRDFPVRLIQAPVQGVPLAELSGSLEAGDLLFIDSTHAVRPGSDVNYLILEVLPRLRPGVLVHFHDIFLPYDYAPDTLDTLFHWSENTLLRAFLTHNHHARIIFCMSHLHHARPDALREVFPDFRAEQFEDGLRRTRAAAAAGHFPASLYFTIV